MPQYGQRKPCDEIAFVVRDITVDEPALEELAKLRVLSTPATLIDRNLVVGFNLKQLAERHNLSD